MVECICSTDVENEKVARLALRRKAVYKLTDSFDPNRVASDAQLLDHLSWLFSDQNCIVGKFDYRLCTNLSKQATVPWR